MWIRSQQVNMETLKIIKYPAKILRVKAINIADPLDVEIQDMVKKMLATVKKENGLGLAAPQIGKSLKLCIINDEGDILVMMNPKIAAFSKSKISMSEGCLSFPGKYREITRPEKVKARYVNEKGEKKKIKATGITARAIQHEIDHLNGILLIDKK